MDTLEAFIRADMARQAGNKLRVFDWDRAAMIIKERGVTHAAAGLSADWEYTGGTILRDGKALPRSETYTYLASLWADPELEIDDDLIECWKFEDELPGWDAETYWPDSALAILQR